MPEANGSTRHRCVVSSFLQQKSNSTPEMEVQTKPNQTRRRPLVNAHPRCGASWPGVRGLRHALLRASCSERRIGMPLPMQPDIPQTATYNRQNISQPCPPSTASPNATHSPTQSYVIAHLPAKLVADRVRRPSSPSSPPSSASSSPSPSCAHPLSSLSPRPRPLTPRHSARRDFRARTRTPPDAPSLAYPSAAPDPSLAHVPAAHLHRPVRPGYAQGQGPVYEDIVLEGAMRRRATDLPAYDAEAKPPRYLDVVS